MTVLQEINENVLMVSVSSNGQTGPEKGYAGYAPMFAAAGGLGHLTGYADGPPVELRHAMDHTGGLMGAFCAVAALCGQKSIGAGANQDNGGGLHLDVAVRDIATAFIGPTLLDFAMNGREQSAQGNGNGAATPHGVYRCAGDDAWVSIAVTSETEWQGLRRALGNPDWAGDSSFGDGYQRWLHREELETRLEEWTRQRTPGEVTETLQREGVAAFPSLAADQLMVDPHLAARESFPEVTHPEKGRQRGVGPPWRFSATPARLDGWTPSLGEDNERVFHGLLGMPLDELRALQDARVVW